MSVKTVLAVALAGLALASLGGCAMMSKKGDPSAMVPATSNNQEDSAYVGRVDQTAHEQGVNVVWVNPPEKQDHN